MYLEEDLEDLLLGLLETFIFSAPSLVSDISNLPAFGSGLADHRQWFLAGIRLSTSFQLKAREVFHSIIC